MIDHALTIFIVFAHRLGAVPPDVCSKSVSIDTSDAFLPRCRSILPLSTSQMVPFLVFRTPQERSNCPSKRSSISEKASFK
jgi:hypothetical protein